MSLSESVCGFFKRGCWDSRSFFHSHNPCWFLQPETWKLIFLALEPWAGGPGVGLGLLAPEISLPSFYLLNVVVRPTHSLSLPLLAVWIDVASLIP